MRFYKNPDICVNGKFPTIDSVRLGFGEKFCKLFLAMHFERFQQSLNVENKLNTVQVDDILGIIIYKFGFLKVTELFCFFVDCLMSLQYEKFYNSVTPQIILRNIKIFIETTREEALRREDERIKEARMQVDRTGTVSYTEYKFMKATGCSAEEIRFLMNDETLSTYLFYV